MGNSKQANLPSYLITQEISDAEFQRKFEETVAKMMSNKLPARKQPAPQQRSFDWSQTSWRGKHCSVCSEQFDDEYIARKLLTSEFQVDYDIVTISRTRNESRDMGSSIQSQNSIFEYFFFHKDCFKLIAGDEYLPKKNLTTGKIVE